MPKPYQTKTLQLGYIGGCDGLVFLGMVILHVFRDKYVLEDQSNCSWFDSF